MAHRNFFLTFIQPFLQTHGPHLSTPPLLHGVELNPSSIFIIKMLHRSATTRRVLSSALSSRHRLSTTAAPPHPTLPHPYSPHPILQDHDTAAHLRSTGPHERKQRKRGRERTGSTYEEEQTRVLRASLSHVVRLGWGESAMIAGARDVGVSPSVVGSFPRKEATLIEFFMDACLQRLIDRSDSGDELQNLILSERLSKLIRIRLEMQAPYISKWPQALSIQALPINLPISFKQRAELVDEIWHVAGDEGSDIDWYVKRTVLGGIYSTSEVYMVTDHSPEFRDTWMFLERRIKDAFELQKTVQEAAYFTETVSAGVENSVQGFMKRIFKG